jgi:hypothetical protein
VFVSKNQFLIFIACLAFGVFSGGILSLISGVKFVIKQKFINTIIDILAWGALGIAFIAYMYYMNFPNIRFYMLFGVMISIVAYFKSFHIILAKFAKKFYNIIVKKKIGNRDTRDDTKKIRKNSSFNHRRRNFVARNTRNGVGVSTDNYEN